MLRKILIDATFENETRLVLCKGSEVEEFDYQTQTKKSIKGNIYLAKITRVEPSLQAAFVDYGGNRNGFLPFSEIHPDYFQIPQSDKDAINKQIENEAKAYNGDDNDPDETFGNTRETQVYSRYKINEVVKKDQVILVQVVKEERGNKGASLTTFISLAGRCCVLMPNSSKAGGVSRKIDDMEERKRLKTIISDFHTKEGHKSSVIIRTAGEHKTKTEIKRDLSYLVRLWSNIREHTLSAKAPAFIHEEGDVIKKSIRDLYDSEVEEIVVAGEEAYKSARDFIKLLLPRHVDKVKQYEEKTPIFVRYGVENQLTAMYMPEVNLPSGGYIVINQTEALIAIDVNSGKSTSERDVESTALKTNLEAAREIAHQLKLRDLSGLIVIDFIDMLNNENKISVEKAFRSALQNDKARSQIGRISTFGLLEMSRQRLRSSFLEGNTHECKYCGGRGRVRPPEATAVAVFRAIAREIADSSFDAMEVSGSKALIFHLINEMREEVLAMEKEAGAKITFEIDEEAGEDGFFIETKNQVTKAQNKALSSIDDTHYMQNEGKKHPSSNRGQSEGRDRNRQPKKTTESPANVKDSEPEHEEKNEDNTTQQRRKNWRKEQKNDEQIVKFDRPKRNNNRRNNNRQRPRKEQPAKAAPKDKSLLKSIWKKIVE
jgi:ribonuclease E